MFRNIFLYHFFYNYKPTKLWFLPLNSLPRPGRIYSRKYAPEVVQLSQIKTGRRWQRRISERKCWPKLSASGQFTYLHIVNYAILEDTYVHLLLQELEAAQPVMKANQPMSCILKSTSDVKAIRESYEGNYIEPNVPDSVGKLDDRAEERTLEKKHEISELCLVLGSSTLSDTERYGHVSSFTHDRYDRCCVKLSPSNMIGSNAKGKARSKANEQVYFSGL